MVAVSAVAAVMRALAVVAYQPILLLQSDAHVYLNRSLELSPSHYRPLLYSVFLKPFLWLHDLRAVAVAQHLLGMAIGLSVYASVWRFTRSKRIALAAAVLPLLDAYAIALEQYGLAETLFTALALGGFLLLLWVQRSHPALALAAGVCLGSAALTRYVGIVLVVPALLLVLCRPRTTLRVTALVAGFVLPIALYATWFQSSTGTFAVTDRGGHFLYGRVASFADCSYLERPDHERVLCELGPRSERPNPNFFVFSKDSPVTRVDPPAGMSVDEVLRDFSMRVIRNQPALYAREVGADLLHYLAPGRWTGRQDNRLNLIRFPVELDDARPFAPLVARREGSPPPEWDRHRFEIVDPPASWLRAYQSVFYLHGPLLAVILLVTVAGIVRAPSWTDRARPLALLLAGVALAAFPVLTVTFDYRFLVPATPFLATGAGIAVGQLRGNVTDGASDRRDPEGDSA